MRDNNGKFTKGNQAAKKEKKQIGSFYAASLPSQERTISEYKPTQYNSNDFIPFGSDNLSPQRFAEIFRRSAVLRSVILSKRNCSKLVLFSFVIVFIELMVSPKFQLITLDDIFNHKLLNLLLTMNPNVDYITE